MYAFNTATLFSSTNFMFYAIRMFHGYYMAKLWYYLYYDTQCIVAYHASSDEFLRNENE